MLTIALLFAAVAATQAGYASLYPYSYAPYSYAPYADYVAPVVKPLPVATSYSHVYKAHTPSYPVIKSYAPVAYSGYKYPLAYASPYKSYYGGYGSYGSYGNGLDYYGLEDYGYGHGYGSYGYGGYGGLGYGYGGYLH